MLKKCTIGISLAVRRLRRHTPNTGGMGSILCPGTRIPQAERPKKKKKKKRGIRLVSNFVTTYIASQLFDHQASQ